MNSVLDFLLVLLQSESINSDTDWSPGGLQGLDVTWQTRQNISFGFLWINQWKRADMLSKQSFKDSAETLMRAVIQLAPGLLKTATSILAQEGGGHQPQLTDTPSVHWQHWQQGCIHDRLKLVWRLILLENNRIALLLSPVYDLLDEAGVDGLSLLNRTILFSLRLWPLCIQQ